MDKYTRSFRNNIYAFFYIALIALVVMAIIRIVRWFI